MMTPYYWGLELMQVYVKYLTFNWIEDHDIEMVEM